VHVIYDLFDSRPGVHVPFYVGITDDLYGRFMQHLRCVGDNEAKNMRLREMLAQGYLPQMRTLEIKRTREEAQVRETYWIHHYLDLGYVLLNEVIPRPLYLKDKATQRRVIERIRRSS
jgi:hypothetical protein